jgi:hypothetical protein
MATIVNLSRTWSNWKPSEKESSEHITMTQKDVWKIFNVVRSAKTVEKAIDGLCAHIDNRRHLSYWLGQIGHQGMVKLGRSKSDKHYIKEVAMALWNRKPQEDDMSEGKDLETTTGDPADVAQPIIDEGNPIHVDDTEQEEEAETQAEAEQTEESTEESEIPQDTTTPDTDGKKKHKREPRTHMMHVWLLFADVVRAPNAEAVESLFTEKFKNKMDVGFWLIKTDYRHNMELGKRRKLPEYLSELAKEMFKVTRDIKI